MVNVLNHISVSKSAVNILNLSSCIMKLKYLFIIVLTLSIFVSCKAKKQAHTSESHTTQSNDNTLNEKRENIIVFLSFNIFKENKKTVVRLKEKKEVVGHLKDIKQLVRNENTYLKILFYHQSDVMEERKITHPLIESVEHPAEEGGVLIQSVITRDSATFFVRAQFSQAITAVEFVENVNGVETKLNTIEIK